MYVMLDGFDLGVGILLLSSRHGPEHDALVDSIDPVWDGNETWLILAAIVLFGAFPLAYSIPAPAFYLPFMVMLVSLASRGVAIEFRVHTPFPRFWDGAFNIGSILAAFAQGLVGGALLSGDIAVAGGRFSGSTLDVFTGFNVRTALAAIAAYASLGTASRRCAAWATPPCAPSAPGTGTRQRTTFACRLYVASLLVFALTGCLLHLLFALIFRLQCP
ncbi:cytochrome d ubiquinol oxidase subunit II [Burkholderia sp. Bp9017]|uniref:cytochrome d ubiquinol oxidase subunit II n=1 Tax=Burkholderia TaxID=32008 RepID=UPI000F60067A|nr:MULTISPECIES: cytochrome d ubiquinol oxidase subunit II [Burkholderia]RQZ30192.1 cytochrome d ubiquinol oxidase subunit II [Burkholderia sp. Bp9017]RQZ36345.1 cytochrome d ubiquinol oxidase subunit II [Burkholderia sp. Bp9016]